MSTPGFYRDLLEENPAMLAQMIAFNRKERPGQEAVVSLPDAWTEKLALFPELEAAFNRACERDALKTRSPHDENREREEGYWSFVTPSERLVLLSREELTRLGKMCAAALLADKLSVSVLQADVKAAKAFLGEEVYHWALYRGRFLPGSLVKSVHAFMPEGDLNAQLVTLSRGVLESVRSQWPDALKQKSETIFALLQLPATPATVEDEALCRGLWYLMKKIILQEFDKKWTPFFN